MKTEFHQPENPEGFVPLALDVPHVERVLSSTAVEIRYHHEKLFDRDFERSEGYRASQDTLRKERGEFEFERSQKLRSNPNSNVATLDGRIAKITAQIAKNEKEHEEDSRKRGGSQLRNIDDAVNRYHGPMLAARNTTDTAIKNKTDIEMLDYCASMRMSAQVALKALQKAPVTREAWEQRIKADVRKWAGDGFNVYGAMHVGLRYPHSPLSQGHVSPPMDGTKINGFAAMCSLFPQMVIDALIKQALEKHDESRALTTAQRDKAIADAKAEILDWEYRAAFWHRKLADAGIDVMPRTTNPWAILDVVAPVGWKYD